MFTITDVQAKQLFTYLTGKEDVPNLVNTLRDELRDHVQKVHIKETRMMQDEIPDYVKDEKSANGLQMEKKIFFYDVNFRHRDINGVFRRIVQVMIQTKPFFGIEMDVVDQPELLSFWKRLKYAIVPKYKRIILLPSHGSLEDMTGHYFGTTVIFGKTISRNEWILNAFPPNTSVTMPDDQRFMFFSPIWQGHHILNYLATSPLNDVVSMSGLDDQDTVAILCRSVYGSSPVAHHIAALIKSEQWKDASIALQAELTKQRQSLFKQIPDLKDGDDSQ